MMQEISEEELLSRLDNDRMLTAGAVSSHKLSTDSNSALCASWQRTRLASYRPVHRVSSHYPRRLHRCCSEHAPDVGGLGGGGLATAHYRSCAELDGSVGASTFHHHRPPSRTHPRRITHLTTINPLQRKDIFYSGSVVSLRGSTMLSGGLHSRPLHEYAHIIPIVRFYRIHKYLRILQLPVNIVV